MVSLVTVLATQAEGETLIHDWMYELRLFALEQLSGMRADLFLCDPHRIVVSGPNKLRGRALDSRDLRSGMALIAAALAAEGQKHAGAAGDGRARLHGRRRAPQVAGRGGRSGAQLEATRAAGVTAADDSSAASWAASPGDASSAGWSAAGSGREGRRRRARPEDAAGRAGIVVLRRRPPAAAAAPAAAARRRRRSSRGRPGTGAGRSTSRSSTRTIRGVSISTMSVCWSPSSCAPNRWPMIGRSLRPAIPSSVVRSSSRIRPASMFVSPSRSRMVVSM